MLRLQCLKRSRPRVLAINQHPILITVGNPPLGLWWLVANLPAVPRARSTTKPASTPQSARVPTITQGPIEQQLKQHESELSALRLSLQNLESKQDTLANQTFKEMAMVKTELKEFVKETASGSSDPALL